MLPLPPPTPVKVSDQISSIDFFWSCAYRFCPSLTRQTGASANVKNEADLCQRAAEAAGNPVIKRASTKQQAAAVAAAAPILLDRA